MSTPRYFFITGTGRSGTTLLQAMLSRGRGVFIPPETHFMPLVWQQRRRLGPITSDRGWAAAKEAIARRNKKAGIETDPALFEQLADEGPRHLATLLTAWLRSAAAQAPNEAPGEAPPPIVIGEKSPVHASFVLELLAMIPDSSVVHIVRDPRDVAVSQREAWNGPTMSAAYRWLLDQRRHEELETLVSPQRFATVRYEDLVTDPEAHLRRVCEVLPVDFGPEMLEPHKRSIKGFAEQETHKNRTLEPVTNSRIGRYRQSLSPRAVAAIERTCRSQMPRFGYEPDTYAAPLAPFWVAAKTAPMVWRKLVSRTPASRIVRQVSRQTPEQPSPTANAQASE